jgi:hypothetical protein
VLLHEALVFARVRAVIAGGRETCLKTSCQPGDVADGHELRARRADLAMRRNVA